MITSFTSLPKGFAGQKPHQTAPPHVLALGSSQFIIQRKRDGQRHYALVQPNGKVRLYSSTIRDMTEHFPLIVEELESHNLPVKTVLDGEIICDRHGIDDFRATNECCRAHAKTSQTAERRLPITYMVFDTLYHGGGSSWRLPYADRWSMIEQLDCGERIIVPETFTRLDLAQRKVHSKRWEGLVLWMRNAPHMIRLDGVYQRHGSYKWKPTQERDFIATGWEPGKGRLAKTMGKLIISEWQHGVDGAGPPILTEICRVGTGFTDLEREAATTWKYPRVVTLKFMFQQEDTRALREPVFVRCEDGKKVKDLQ